MAKKKKSSFKGRVGKNANRTNSSSYGYLNLPNGVSVFKPKPDTKVTLDFLPYEVSVDNHPDKTDGVENGTQWYKRPFRIHQSIGVDKEKVVCLKSFGKKCPICEYQAKLRNEKGGEEEIKSLAAKYRNLYVVLDVNSDEKKPQIFDMSDFLFQQKLQEELNEDENYEIFPDLEEGMSLKLRFTEDTFAGNSFAKLSRIDFIKRKKQHKESFIKEVPNLDKVLQELTYDQLSAKLFELDDVTEEKEAKKDKRKKKKVKEEKAPVKEKKNKKEEKPGKVKCPFKHKFGKDYKNYSDCDDCKLSKKCKKANGNS